MHYEVTVPDHAMPGDSFVAYLGGIPMNVIVPPGCVPGSLIQVLAPQAPTAIGVPVFWGNACGAQSSAAIPSGMPVPNNFPSGMPVPNTMFMGRVYAADGVMGPPEIAYVEVEEISTAGMLCLIIGCFTCPGLNLLGLCMRERRLVPVSHLY